MLKIAKSLTEKGKRGKLFWNGTSKKTPCRISIFLHILYYSHLAYSPPKDIKRSNMHPYTIYTIWHIYYRWCGIGVAKAQRRLAFIPPSHIRPHQLHHYTTEVQRGQYTWMELRIITHTTSWEELENFRPCILTMNKIKSQLHIYYRALLWEQICSFALEQLHLHRTQGTCVRTDKLYHSAIICFENNRMCTETVCKEKDIIHIVCTVATFVCTVVTLRWIWWAFEPTFGSLHLLWTIWTIEQMLTKKGHFTC